MDDVSISYMGWHPSHGRTHMFQDGSNHQPYIYIYIYTYGGFFMRTPSINGGFGSWEKSSKGWVLEAAMFAKG
jgi:hypothetical protein